MGGGRYSQEGKGNAAGLKGNWSFSGCGVAWRSVKPVFLLLILVVAGVVAALWLKGRPLASASDPLTTGGGVSDRAGDDGALLVSLDGKTAAGGEAGTIQLLEGQVEYLEGQVRVLREENEALLAKLGRLGMAEGAGAAAMQGLAGDLEEPDFVGLGIELMTVRQLDALPITALPIEGKVVREKILDWLRSQQPGDQGERWGQALHALGWIPEAVDPLPSQADLMLLQLGAWYDAEEGTLFVDDGSGGEIMGQGGPYREALGVAWAQALREFGPTLFGKNGTAGLKTDERLGRLALIGGDAGLTRFLHSLQNPSLVDAKGIPVDDPDHPYNAVPLPDFLRQLHFFPVVEGFEFVQGLHSAGEFAQVNASYSRPPLSTAEVLDSERYLGESGLQPVAVSWPDLKVMEQEPIWDDVLGQFAVRTALRTWNDEERAGLGSRGWVGDRLLVYAAAEADQRGHAVWQTLWQDGDWAEAFYRAMMECLKQRYGVEIERQGEAIRSFVVEGRRVALMKNRDGQGVLLMDCAEGPFNEALRERFEAAK